ncbi:MAG: hypothetical protein HYU64_03115 [Armatimonadetes bacterium]|nr:hypothetical protein [Armatimonadota bacterium]
MAGKLKAIVDYVQKNSTFGGLAVAKMTMMLKEDVSKVTDATPDDAAKIQKFREVAKEILKVDSIPV